MKRLITGLSAAVFFSLGIAPRANAQGAQAGATIQSMQWARRIVLLAAPDAENPEYQEQRRLLASWAGAAEREVSVVHIAGNRVTGAADAASALRDRYRLPADLFTVILIGKDGHVAFRSTTPVRARILDDQIDAMPMRRAARARQP